MIGRIGRVGKTYRNIIRYREIIAVLMKYGFSDFISRIKIDKYLGIHKKKAKLKDKPGDPIHATYHRIRMAIEELGPTFIKFGQLLSNRPDILPIELIHELENLQSNVSPCKFDDIEAVFEKEFGSSPSKIFLDFQVKPLGCASIAQVHKAKLTSGEDVVVKIRRPGIVKTIETDLEILHHLATLVENNIPELKFINPVQLIEEFGNTIRKETNFTIEQGYLYHFKSNFENNRHVYVPKIYPRYCSSGILTIEYINGIPIQKIANSFSPSDIKKVIDTGVEAFMQQIFKHNFFHADPHPGNLFILPDKRICFLDFGMMGIIPPNYKSIFTDLVLSIIQNDISKTSKLLLKLSATTPDIDNGLFESRIQELLLQFRYIPLSKINVSDVFNTVVKIIVDFRLQMPPLFFLLARALSTIDGTARQLLPDFNVLESIKPYAAWLIKEKLNPVHNLKKVYNTVYESIELFQELPESSKELLDQLKQGRVTINFEHKGLEPVLKRNDQITNRISFAIILSALIIGSSLIAMSNIPPLWHDIPVIGVVGFVMAGIMGFWLLIMMMKRGRF